LCASATQPKSTENQFHINPKKNPRKGGPGNKTSFQKKPDQKNPKPKSRKGDPNPNWNSV
jgi:hypothetical protein